MNSSTLDEFVSRSTASPYALGLGLSLASISYFFWGNLAGQTMGAIAIPIHPKARAKIGLDVAKSVEVFAWAYKLGFQYFGGSGTGAGVSTLLAAFTIPKGTPISRSYLLLLSVLMFSNGIYTLLFMLPTNNRLLGLRDKIVERRSQSLKEASLTAVEEQEAVSLLQKWRWMHYVRITMGGASWLGALAAYVTTV